MAPSFVTTIHDSHYISRSLRSSLHTFQFFCYVFSVWKYVGHVFSHSGQNNTLHTCIIYKNPLSSFIKLTRWAANKMFLAAKNIWLCFCDFIQHQDPSDGSRPLVHQISNESRASITESLSEFFDAQEVLLSASSSENEVRMMAIFRTPPELCKYSLSRDQLPLFSSLLQSDTTLTPIRRQRNGMIILNVQYVPRMTFHRPASLTLRLPYTETDLPREFL